MLSNAKHSVCAVLGMMGADGGMNANVICHDDVDDCAI